MGTRETEDRGHDVAMALRDAYWAMHRQADAALQPRDVTANQFVLLALLAEEDGITQRQLVERASSDANTVRAMLVALERKGLVLRRRHPSDGRARCVTLSAKGRRTFETSWAESDAFRRRLLAAFQPGEVGLLVELLSRVTEAMEPRSRSLAESRTESRNEE